MGGRGAKSSIKTGASRTSLNTYFRGSISNTKDRLDNKQFKLDSGEYAISNGYSMIVSKDNFSLDTGDKKMNAPLNHLENLMRNNISNLNVNYNDDFKPTENFTGKEFEGWNGKRNMSFDEKRINKIKKVMGKDTKAIVTYNSVNSKGQYQQDDRPIMYLMNKKGDRALLMPQARY